MIVHEVERRQQRELDGVFEAIRRDVAAEHELPVEAIVLIKAGSIPKTSSGKIQRHACRAWLSGRHAGNRGRVARLGAPTPAWLRAAAPATPARRVRSRDRHRDRRPRGDARRRSATARLPRRLRRPARPRSCMEHVRRVAKERAVGMTLDSSIVELGLDSLERMEIIAVAGRDLRRPLSRRRAAADRNLPRSGRGRRSLPGPSAQVEATGAAPSEIPPENYRFELFPEYPAAAADDARDRRRGLDESVLQGARARHRRHDADRRPRADQLFELQLPRHVGRSARCRGGQAGHRPLRHQRLGQPPGLRREDRSTASWNRRSPSSLGAEAAIVFVGGHGTNETTIGHLFGPGDLILHDALAHNSIVQGAILSGARRRPFPHNDWQALDKLLAELRADVSPRADRDRRRLQHGRRHRRPAAVHRSQEAAQGASCTSTKPIRSACWARTAAASASISTFRPPTSTSGWARSARRSAAAAATSPAARPWSST